MNLAGAQLDVASSLKENREQTEDCFRHNDKQARDRKDIPLSEQRNIHCNSRAEPVPCCESSLKQ